MTSRTECKDCNRLLVGLAEQSLGLCLDCMAKLPKLVEELQAKITSLTAEGLQAVKELTSVAEAYNKRLSLDSAERSGREAASRGFDLDQNPYKDDDTRLMWEHGHHQGSLERQLAENQAVVAWALTELPLIHELAVEFGPDEVAGKLDAVIQKLTPVVAELLQS